MSEENGDVPKKKQLTKKRETIAVDIEELDGSIKEYLLTEMSGTVRDQWMTSMGKRMRIDAQGNPVGVNDFKGLQSSLICLCLSLVGNPVGEDEIQRWPASTQKELFEMAQEMNGLTAVSAAAAKKD